MSSPDLLLKCAGFGGQGVLTLGEIIATAAMQEGRNVSWLPSYGPESRGGTCNCDVILSDGEIASPVIYHPGVVIVFNQPSMDRFFPDAESDANPLKNFIWIGRRLSRHGQLHRLAT